MQIHELNKRTVQREQQRKPAPVTGLDTSKVSPYIAAQIKKAEADSQAKLTQQAQQAQQASATTPTQPAPAPAQPTRPQNTPVNPNVKPGGSKEAQAFRAQQAASTVTMANTPVSKTNTAPAAPSWRDNIKGLGKAVKNAAVDSTRGTVIANKPGGNTAPSGNTGTVAPDMTAELSKIGITNKQLAGIGKILQQTSNYNTRLTNTGDPAVDKFLQAMGYNVR